MSRGDRFKTGDEIIKVVAKDKYDGPWEVMGVKAIVHRCDGDGAPLVTVNIDGRESFKDFIDDRDYELEVVANSPLYKALE